MSNIILAVPLSDQATLTASSALADNTVNRLQDMGLSRIWRTSDLNTADIEIDFGAATEIDFIAIVAHNGTASGSVTIKAGTTSAVSDFTLAGQDLITGTDVGYDKNLFAVRLSSSETYRYWKIEISDASNPDAYFQAGRLYMDKCFSPAINASWGLSEGFKDNSRLQRSMSQALNPVTRTPLRTVDLQIDFGTEDEMYGVVYEIDRLRGISKDILYIKNIEATTHFQRQYVYGVSDDLTPIINEFFGIYQKSYKITEIK